MRVGRKDDKEKELFWLKPWKLSAGNATWPEKNYAKNVVLFSTSVITARPS